MGDGPKRGPGFLEIRGLRRLTTPAARETGFQRVPDARQRVMGQPGASETH